MKVFIVGLVIVLGGCTSLTPIGIEQREALVDYHSAESKVVRKTIKHELALTIHTVATTELSNAVEDRDTKLTILKELL